MARSFSITHPAINEYLRSVQTRRHPILRPMEAYAEKHGFPIIGPLVGPILYQLATMIRARRVFELGSGYGYSAVWFSQAVGPRGKVIMTEGDAGNSARAMRYLKRARLASRVKPLVGDALSLLRAERGTFDVILNDIDKWQYPEAFPIVRKKLRRGGLFITDNMLWSGRVLEKRPDRNTRGILALTRLLYAASDFFTVLLPVRDGVTVSLKL
ncbi:MAG TPA: O-methyltransferase [Candidatus Limnocylindrales bacterium]|nr:O-methyltransferase [Candidatus Limnocylindrales bacterium]